MGNDTNAGFISFGRIADPIVGGAAAGGAAALGMKYAIHKPIRSLAEKSLKSVESMNSVFRDGALTALSRENIKYMDLTSPLGLFLDDDFMKFVEKHKPSKIEKKWGTIKKQITPKKILKIKNKKINKRFTNYCEGIGAFCADDKIYANFDKAAATTFHEMGHVKNYTEGGLGKFLKTLRNPLTKKIGLGIALASAVLITSEKNSDNEISEQKGFIQKTGQFLKKNCVGIAALSCTPVLLEEGLASIKGWQIAKSVLSKEAYKTVNKLNGKAWLTYLTSTVTLCLGVFAASKVRDLIANDKSS